jgi:surfactin synthase thioesterase subunit
LANYLINHEKDRDEALILFPFAGGGANIYRHWSDYFPATNVMRVLYPGRESRFSETPISEISELVQEIYDELVETFNFEQDYYLFGHSMGTKIVYELALKIKHSGLNNPKAVIISAGRAPCFKEPDPIYHLDDAGFKQGLQDYGGTPKEVLENDDLIKMFLPMLRADFVIDEEYQDMNKEPLDSPILALMGTSDEQMTLEELLEWEQYTTKSFRWEYVEGGHMFINDNSEEAINKIKAYLNEI